jgi:dual specificity protein kinase YAK1
MANREAFIDFVHGLLNINPLERWSPQQARTHPFITQQKFTGPFQPQMNLKASSRSPAPGVQQQQQAEAMSKQRAQQAQQAQAQQAAYAGMHMSPGYPTSPAHSQQMYSGMYTPSNSSGAPPPYPSQPPSAAAAAAYGSQMPMIQPPAPTASTSSMSSMSSMQPYPSGPPQQNLYAQATTRAGRQRASTMDNNNGIPAALQRVVSHLDPNAPIRLQPSPAYYPPPQDGSDVSSSIGNVGGRRRTSRGAGQQRMGENRNFVRVLEDRTLEEGWSGGGPGSGTGWPA